MRVPSVPQLLLVCVAIGGCLSLSSGQKIRKTVSTWYRRQEAARSRLPPKFTNAKNVASSASGLAKGAANASKDGISNVVSPVNATKDATIGVANATKDGFKEAVDSAKEAVDNVVALDDVCYDGLGCFSMSSPWYTLLRPLPKPYSPVDIDTQFYLYTRLYPGRYTVTWRFSNDSDSNFQGDGDGDADGGMTLSGSDYDGSRKTFFITHGFASDGNFSWVADMKDALLKKFDCNVFLVDWGKGAKLLNYLQVSSNTRVVAAVLAKLGHYLVDRHNADPSRMHAIGHSLGAQISAYFAKNITTLGRLTALDPAQPAFEGYDRLVRLDVTDAALVDVVHTTARPTVPFAGLGMVAAYGHIDFYMNGGWGQPGCYLPENINITSFTELASAPVEALTILAACAHSRSYEFFTASLQINNTFWGHRISEFDKFLSTLTGGYGARYVIPDDDCDAESCSPFGYDAFDFPARGKFAVATTDSFPYVVPEPSVDARMQQYRGQRPEPQSDEGRD